MTKETTLHRAATALGILSALAFVALLAGICLTVIL